MLFFTAILFLLSACGNQQPLPETAVKPSKISEITPPPGYVRAELKPGSFGEWLRDMKLKEDNTVRLFDGRVKPNQKAHFAVLDIRTGEKDLQQCADAIIRLRAEYLFDKGEYASIAFLSTSMQEMSFLKWCGGWRYRLRNNRLEGYQANIKVNPDRNELNKWLEFVFLYAGTYSLQRQLRPVAASDSLMAGDVIVEGGFPGHAMIVLDVCRPVNGAGEPAFMLAQSYMPAQDMHVVINPAVEGATPWYFNKPGYPLATPEWSFRRLTFYRW